MTNVVGKFYSGLERGNGFKRKNGIWSKEAVGKFYTDFLLTSY
jgi:hypothetical protein